MTVIDTCPCGSGKAYSVCCGPYLTGTDLPTSPEQLMRSRYTAFYEDNVDYLIATHHPSEHEPNHRRLLTEAGERTRWVGLRVLHADEPTVTGKGTVEFVAFYQFDGVMGQMHERSNFVRQDDRWYYLNGTRMDPIVIGRNDPCWCGSGRKLKKCHGS